MSPGLKRDPQERQSWHVSALGYSAGLSIKTPASAYHTTCQRCLNKLADTFSYQIYRNWDLQPQTRARVKAGAVYWTSGHKRVVFQNKWFFWALHRLRKCYLGKKTPLLLSYPSSVTQAYTFTPSSRLDQPPFGFSCCSSPWHTGQAHIHQQLSSPDSLLSQY